MLFTSTSTSNFYSSQIEVFVVLKSSISMFLLCYLLLFFIKLALKKQHLIVQLLHNQKAVKLGSSDHNVLLKLGTR